MKKLIIISLLFHVFTYGQFSVKIQSPQDFSSQEAYLYTLNGSKDILLDKAVKKNNTWSFNVKNPYTGMMKVYFPEVNSSLTFITQNSNVDLKFSAKNNKVGVVDYLDNANKLFYELQDQQKKKEQLLSALYQIQNFYRSDSDFGKSLKNEIDYLNSEIVYNPNENKFIQYYNDNYVKFLSETAGKTAPTNNDIINFLNTTTNYLETSSLLKSILISFLGNTTKVDLASDVDKLIKTVNIETPRGQTILSELIEIFDVYSISDLKKKYLDEAKSLKCTINDRLTSTIKSNKNTEIGAIIPNNKFIKPINTTAKSLYDVKADKKILIFWASTCPHCEKEITEMLSKYNDLKSKNIEIVGLSLDTDNKSYSEKVKLLPWINDTELKGWYSSYVDTYNIHSTPTFYILDSKNKIIANPTNFTETLEFLGLK